MPSYGSLLLPFRPLLPDLAFFFFFLRTREIQDSGVVGRAKKHGQCPRVLVSSRPRVVVLFSGPKWRQYGSKNMLRTRSVFWVR